MDERRALLDLVRDVRARMEWLEETGVEYVPRSRDPVPSTATGRTFPDPMPVTPISPTQIRSATTPEAPVPLTDLLVPAAVRESTTLPGLRAAIGDCDRCKLAPHRTNLVFGIGNPKAELVFVGEAPGRDEDLKGEPFVGRAGQLLTEIIVKGMKLRREDVYIANIIKCRPPQNRNPEPDEIASCEPFLVRQLALIGPKVIVALGTFAAQTLLQTRTPITRLRGQWTSYHGVPLMPTFHPAYLLRNPAEKRVVWQDIQQVMAALNIPR